MTKAKQNLDPQKIFENAGKFQWTYEHLQKLDKVALEDMTKYAADPGMVLSAFASELYLKCLLVIFSIPEQQFRSEHSLDKLYQKLPQQIKERIETLWDQDIWQQHKRDFLGDVEGMVQESIPRHFRTLLKFGGNTFIELRYVYEQNPRNINNLLVELPSILRRVIVEIHPGWNQ